jgi:thiamine pyrophosphokinase
MVALIVAGGDIAPRDRLDDAWPGWDTGVDLVVAADGGALNAERLGIAPDVVVGDADSLTPDQLRRLRDADVPVELSPVAKDATDLELALGAALTRGARALVILGAFGGGRFDHALGNLALLALPALRDRPTVMLDATTRVRYLAAPPLIHELLTGRVGDVVSLLPLGGSADGVTTSGLTYPLHDEPLEVGSSRGISNVRCEHEASVSLRRGHLFVIETTDPQGATG